MLALLAGLSSLPVAAAPVYKWQDEAGRWHFSDRRPPDDETPVTRAEPGPANIEASGAAREGLNTVFPAETEAEKALRRQQQERQRQEDQQRRAACDRARTALKTLEGPVVFSQPDGGYAAVSEDERARRASQLAARIREHCPRNNRRQ
jgi:hypothetical protein